MPQGQFEDLVQTVTFNNEKHNIIDYYNDLFVPSIRNFLR